MLVLPFSFFILSMTVTNFLLSAYGKAPGIRRHVNFCVPLPIICKERMIRHGKSGGKKMAPGRSRRCIGNFHRSSILVCPAETQAGSGGISGTDCHVDSIGCKKSLIKISGTFFVVSCLSTALSDISLLCWHNLILFYPVAAVVS